MTTVSARGGLEVSRIVTSDKPAPQDLAPKDLDQVTGGAVAPAQQAPESDRKGQGALATFDGMMADGPNERMW